MRTPRWLVALIVGTVVTTCGMSVAWWATCSFYVGPQIFKAAIEGKIQEEPKVCENVEDRAVQILTGLLATLLGLMSNPPGDKP